MSKLILKLKHALQVPVHLELLSPDKLAGKRTTELSNHLVWQGNTQVKLKTLFDIEGDVSGDVEQVNLDIVGDLSRTRRIGFGMTAGTLHIMGGGGLFVGESMKGGTLLVEGDVGSWLGSNMKGGAIQVSGNAGDFVGAASRGATKGMSGGNITIKGNAGSETGARMHAGTIRMAGNSEMFPGVHMRGGTIHIAGDCQGRAGTQMVGGKIIVSGGLPTILPSFSFEDIRAQTKIEKDSIQGPFYTFTGDNNEEGNGRLFVNVQHNPQLKWYEKFLET